MSLRDRLNRLERNPPDPPKGPVADAYRVSPAEWSCRMAIWMERHQRGEPISFDELRPLTWHTMRETPFWHRHLLIGACVRLQRTGRLARGEYLAELDEKARRIVDEYLEMTECT